MFRSSLIALRTFGRYGVRMRREGGGVGVGGMPEEDEGGKGGS